MEKKPDPVDVHVGKNIRVFRLAKGLSQAALGEKLGITFQQIQKYEKGVNRVGSSRLSGISKILGVPVGRFFEDGGAKETGDTSTSEVVTDLLSKPYALRMLKALAGISDNKMRLSLVELTENLAREKR